MSCLEARGDGVHIHIKVVPGASRDRIMGLLGDALKIQVAAPPEKGKANKVVVELLAKALGVGARQVSVISGAHGPRKVLRVTGLSLEAARSALGID